MHGIYTTKRKTGIADYQPPDEARVREKVELVPSGPNMTKRLSDARKRAAKALVLRQAAIAEGRYESVAQRRRVPTFAEYVEESYIPR